MGTATTVNAMHTANITMITDHGNYCSKQGTITLHTSMTTTKMGTIAMTAGMSTIEIDMLTMTVGAITTNIGMIARL